jgi:hypothetical protein
MYEKTRGQKSLAAVHLHVIEWHRKPGFGEDLIKMAREIEVTPGGMLHTSTDPLPMRYTTMGYTSMRYTSTALYFHKQFTQAPNKIFLKHFKQNICK